MNKNGLIGIVKNVKKSMKKHSPEILTGIGIAGMVTTAVMAVRATPKALKIIENYKEEVLPDYQKIPPAEAIKLCWKCYLPSTIVGGLSITCLIGASSANLRRNAALATAYTLSESALKEYQEKVVEVIGDKKEQAIKDSIAKDKIEQNPVASREVIITDSGDTLCLDLLSGRYFKSDIDTIKKAINELNRQMLSDMYISLNDFYYEIGLDNTKIGEDLGWHIDDGLIEISFSSQLANEKTPCLVLDYRVAPQYDYRR